MVSVAARRGALVVLLALAAACSDSPAAPASAPLPALVAEPPPRTFPPLEGPARTFGFDRDAGFRVGDHTRTSRFILYDNGAFELQYDGLASYRGRYTLSDATVVFEFQANPASGGVAMGTLQDGELVVRYNLNMRLSDFDDAVYVLRP